MLSSIHPLGERARHNRWSITAAAYTAGSLAGALLVGAAAGALGQLTIPPPGRTAAVAIALAAVVTAAVLLVELLAPGRRLPGPSRQVNEDWLVRYRGWVYGAGFGVQLGAGVTTQVTSAAIYGWIALAALSGRVATGALVGAAFGLARAAPILLVARVHRPDQLRRFHARFQRFSPVGRGR